METVKLSFHSRCSWYFLHQAIQGETMLWEKKNIARLLETLNDFISSDYKQVDLGPPTGTLIQLSLVSRHPDNFSRNKLKKSSLPNGLWPLLSTR